MDNISGSEQNSRQYSLHNQSTQNYSNKYSLASSNSNSPVFPPLPPKQIPSYYIKKVEDQNPLTFTKLPIVRFYRSYNSPVSKLNHLASKDLMKPSSPIAIKTFIQPAKVVLEEPTSPRILQAQRSGPKIKRLTKLDKDKKVVAIIVSFCNGNSYDKIFTTVEQKTLQGTQVLVY